MRCTRNVGAVFFQAHTTYAVATRKVTNVHFNVVSTNLFVPAVANLTAVLNVARVPL